MPKLAQSSPSSPIFPSLQAFLSGDFKAPPVVLPEEYSASTGCRNREQRFTPKVSNLRAGTPGWGRAEKPEHRYTVGVGLNVGPQNLISWFILPSNHNTISYNFQPYRPLGIVPIDPIDQLRYLEGLTLYGVLLVPKKKPLVNSSEPGQPKKLGSMHVNRSNTGIYPLVMCTITIENGHRHI